MILPIVIGYMNYSNCCPSYKDISDSEAANALMRSALETRNDLAIMLNEARRGKGCDESGKEPPADFNCGKD